MKCPRCPAAALHGRSAPKPDFLNRRAQAAAHDAKRVVVAWWGGDVSDLARSLAAFAPRGSTVAVVAPERPKVLPVTPNHRYWKGLVGFGAIRHARSACSILQAKRAEPVWGCYKKCSRWVNLISEVVYNFLTCQQVLRLL